MSLKTIERKARIAATLIQLVLLAVIWWIITEGAQSAWLIGVPAIVLTSVVLSNTASRSRHRLRITALPGFVTYFAVQSLRGGTDVALRAVSLRLDLRPAILECEWQLPPGAPRTLAAMVMNLLPGTLMVQDQGRCLSVHVIDASESVAEEIASIEKRVAALFGLHLRTSGHSQ